MNELRTLRKIEQLAQRFVGQIKAIDLEDLSVRIWIEITEKGQEAGWTIVRNRCIDEIRRLKVRREAERFVGIRAGTKTEESPEREAETRELLDRLMTCPFLSRDERALLYQRYYVGRTSRQIAEQNGGSKTSVNRRIETVIEKLRRWATLERIGQRQDRERTKI